MAGYDKREPFSERMNPIAAATREVRYLTRSSLRDGEPLRAYSFVVRV